MFDNIVLSGVGPFTVLNATNAKNAIDEARMLSQVEHWGHLRQSLAADFDALGPYVLGGDVEQRQLASSIAAHLSMAIGALSSARDEMTAWCEKRFPPPQTASEEHVESLLRFMGSDAFLVMSPAGRARLAEKVMEKLFALVNVVPSHPEEPTRFGTIRAPRYDGFARKWEKTPKGDIRAVIPPTQEYGIPGWNKHDAVVWPCLLNRPCVAAVDLHSSDVSSLVLAFFVDGHVFVLPHFFIGFGPNELRGRVRSVLRKARATYNVTHLCCDRWQGADVEGLAFDANNPQPLPVVYVKQGYKDVSPLVQRLLSLVQSGRLHHGGDIELSRQASSVRFDVDQDGQRKVRRANPDKSVSGIISLLMCLHALKAGLRPQPPKGSVRRGCACQGRGCDNGEEHF